MYIIGLMVAFWRCSIAPATFRDGRSHTAVLDNEITYSAKIDVGVRRQVRGLSGQETTAWNERPIVAVRDCRNEQVSTTSGRRQHDATGARYDESCFDL